jgi:hypothetical protein
MKLVDVYKFIIPFVLIAIIVDSIKTPLLVIGLFIFVASHELGHALTASWFGAFWGFTIHNGNPTTIINQSLIPKNLMPINYISGILANLMFAPIIIQLFSILNITLVQYLLLVLLLGSGDIYCICTRSVFRLDDQ